MNTPNPNDRTESGEAESWLRLCAADRLADEVANLVMMRRLDARSAAADALLDYRNPPQSERSDRITDLETSLSAATSRAERAEAEVKRLKQRLLTAAGDDLCRLSQEEIKDLTGGKVPIPPKDEFLASCERFREQIAAEAGMNQNCLTLAQLIAENERLEEFVERCRQIANGSATPACDVAWALAEYDKALNPQPQTREDETR